MGFQLAVDAVDCLSMVGLRIGLFPELLRHDIAVLLIELGENTLLRIETAVPLLVGHSGLELLLRWVVHLLESSSAHHPGDYLVDKEGLHKTIE